MSRYLFQCFALVIATIVLIFIIAPLVITARAIGDFVREPRAFFEIVWAWAYTLFFGGPRDCVSSFWATVKEGPTPIKRYGFWA